MAHVPAGDGRERSRPESAPGTTLAPQREEQTELSDVDGPFRTVVWNDPVNLMSYVVYVFRRHFGYSLARAEQLMQLVHSEGRATVSRGSREKVESDVRAMHGYGLHATIESGGGEGED